MRALSCMLKSIETHTLNSVHIHINSMELWFYSVLSVARYVPAVAQNRWVTRCVTGIYGVE